MIRFVLGPGRALVPDLANRLPGRGLWLSAQADVLDTALRKGAFARAARCDVRVPAELPALLQEALRRRIAELLGFARRAGQAVAGFEKAREWVRSGRARLVLQASDGSPEERRRLLSGAGEMPVYAPLDAAVLGAMFGRERAVHVAVAPGRLAEALLHDNERLLGLVAPAMMNQDSGKVRQAGR